MSEQQLRSIGRLSRQATLMRSSALRELLASGTPQRLSLAGGLPPAEAFPFDDIAEIAAELLGGHDARSLQYTAAEGDPQLRAQLAELIGAPAARIVVTTGSQQGIDLVGRVMLDPGDVAVVENPAYVGALRALVPTGARIVGIPCDRDGMDVDVLAAQLADGLRPKLCYVCTNFSNPHGATLSAARREQLAWLCGEYGFVVIEDDQYGRLRFRGEHLAPIASMTNDVVYLSGFSKVVAPGLRVGYLAAPEWLVRPLVLAKQATDLAASSLAQRIVSRLLDRPEWWTTHLAKLRAIYAERADALMSAVEKQLPGRLTVRPPEGGMFVWAEIIAPGVTSAALIAACRERGLALVPGTEFTVDPECSFALSLRLSYSTLTPDELCEAVGLMAAAFDDIP
jgi:2-aminoadipate transaminase